MRENYDWIRQRDYRELETDEAWVFFQGLSSGLNLKPWKMEICSFRQTTFTLRPETSAQRAAMLFALNDAGIEACINRYGDISGDDFHIEVSRHYVRVCSESLSKIIESYKQKLPIYTAAEERLNKILDALIPKSTAPYRQQFFIDSGLDDSLINYETVARVYLRGSSEKRAEDFAQRLTVAGLVARPYWHLQSAVVIVPESSFSALTPQVIEQLQTAAGTRLAQQLYCRTHFDGAGIS